MDEQIYLKDDLNSFVNSNINFDITNEKEIIIHDAISIFKYLYNNNKLHFSLDNILELSLNFNSNNISLFLIKNIDFNVKKTFYKAASGSNPKIINYIINNFDFNPDFNNHEVLFLLLINNNIPIIREITKHKNYSFVDNHKMEILYEKYESSNFNLTKTESAIHEELFCLFYFIPEIRMHLINFINYFFETKINKVIYNKSFYTNLMNKIRINEF
tara:strand:- start:598 stop:1245 length:648 start_codon:yes stop_codon:yes gene_type:complete